SKTTCGMDEFVSGVEDILTAVHDTLLTRARDFRDQNIVEKNDLNALEDYFKSGGIGYVKIGSDVIDDPAYDGLKKRYSLSSRCMPMADGGKTVLVGKAY
ncbi:MAG: hypothetical protein ACPGRX_07255, partial [Bdellovibrionales bacterium]